MTAHDWFIEHREGFTCRALAPDEERLFLEHLARCAECQQATAELARDLGALAFGAGPVAPPPGFVRRVTEAVLARPVPVWRRWAWPVAAAAALLLGAATTWRASTAAVDARAALARAEGRVAALEDTLSVMRGANRVLQASMRVNGSEAGVIIFADERTHRWKVVVHGLPAPPAGERYTFWFVCPDGMVRGADVTPERGTPVILTLGMPEGAGPVLGASLTLEPMSGDGKPRGPELMHLDL